MSNSRTKTKMTKDIVPEDFSMSLALTDLLPVLFFGLSMVVIGLLFKSLLFLFGASLCLFAGFCKVIWKIIVIVKRKNVWWLFLQMRILMPIGFVIMILAGILSRNNVTFSETIGLALKMPSALFFSLGIVGMILMTVFAFALDGSKAKNNWIEQITNAVAQLFIFLGLLFILI